MKLQDELDKSWTDITLDSGDVNEDFTIAMLSTNDKKEFAKLAFQFCVKGTTFEELDDDWYEKKTLLIRHFISKMYIKAPMPKVYNKLMTILERRDARHWSSDSKIRTIDILQPNNDVKVTISDF